MRPPANPCGVGLVLTGCVGHGWDMQRVMIIGQPGSGKSTLARLLGEKTFLPVVHMDHIHWKPGWVERDQAAKTRMVLDEIAHPAWIFEGGHSRTYAARLARADTLIWLDVSVGLRLSRVLWRTARGYGRTRPDLPEGCPEQFSAEFLRWIWRTRHSARSRMQALFDRAVPPKTRVRLTSLREVRTYLSTLDTALAAGHLGIPHR